MLNTLQQSFQIGPIVLDHGTIMAKSPFHYWLNALQQSLHLDPTVLDPCTNRYESPFHRVQNIIQLCHFQISHNQPHTHTLL